MRTRLSIGVLLFVWIMPAVVPAGSMGTAIWRSSSSTVPLSNDWDGASFGTSDSTANVGVWSVIAGAGAPTRAEILALGVDESGYITGMMQRDASWLAVPFNPLGSVTEALWWGFGIAYEQQSGRALMVWNNGDSGTHGISYRTWNGSSWSPEDSVTTPLGGEPKHMHLAANPTSDEIVLVASNASSQDYVLVWDGSSWGNDQILDSGSGDDRTDISVAYEQQSGQAMVVYGKGSTNAYSRIWDGTWKSETPIAIPGGVSGNARWVRLAADANSNNILLGVLTSNADVWFSVWEGTAWGASIDATTSANGTGFPNMDVAFENVSGMGMATYAEGSSVRYLTWMNGMGWSGELTAATLGNTANSMTLDADPASDEIMLSVQDDDKDLTHVHWNGAGWDAPDENETDTGETEGQPFIFIWDTGGQEVVGINYYVSATGDDAADGLSMATAWRSMDNGDQLGQLIPGDTVNVLSGLYLTTSACVLTTSGTESKPVVYRKLGPSVARIYAIDGIGAVINMQGRHAILDSIHIGADILTAMAGVQVDADSCTVRGCVVTDINNDGLIIIGNHNLVLRNVVANATGSGIYNSGEAENNNYYGNTVYSCGGNGIEIKVPMETARIFNNIVVLNDNGIDAKAGNACGFNDVWNNTSAGYNGGVADSSGGVSIDPLFVNPSGINFHLRQGSVCIDAGLDQGYSYNGSDPDMGACEYSTHTPVTYYVSPTGDDKDDGLGPASAWLSIDNGDRKGLLFPGDTVNVLPGTYTPSASIQLTTGGTSSRRITYRKSGTGNVVVDFEGRSAIIVKVEGDNTSIDSLELKNSTDQGLHIVSDSCIVRGLYIHDTGKEGMRVEGSDCLFLRNVSAYTGQEGINNEAGGQRNRYFNNTLYSNASYGFALKENTARVFNNIVALNNEGIDGNVANTCANNNVWGNPGGDYTGGVVDSAGGISVEPGLINPAVGDFRLESGAAEIDAGLDVGYPFNGDAPDMGAAETDYSDSIAYVIVTPPSATLAEGSSRQYTASGYNADSLFVEDLTDSVAWSTDDPSGSVTVGGLYTAGHDLSPPDYNVIATYEALNDSGTVTVVSDGTLRHIQVETSEGRAFPDTILTTDNDTTRLYCRGYDSGDNPLGDQAVTWSVLGGDVIGGVSPMSGASTILTLSSVGTGRIEAVYDTSIKDTSEVITCTAGEPAELVVSPDEATVSADSTLQFTAAAYDADGNPAGPTPAPSWEVLGGIGSIDGLGLFTAGTVGAGNVVGTTAGLTDTTGTITVVPGDIAYIDVMPVTALVIEDSSYQFSAHAYDADSNFVSDASGDCNWSTTDPFGSVSPAGLYTAGTDPSPPPYYVTATFGVSRDSSKVTVLSSGSLRYVRIEWLDGTPVVDTTLTTDDDGTTFYCRAYDSADSLLGEAPALWSLIGEDSIGSVDEGPETFAYLTLSQPGTGHVVTTYGGGISDTTGVLTCMAGVPARVAISPDTATITAGATIQFTTATFDADGNPAIPVTTSTWDVLGGIGAFSPAGLFTASTAGAGSVTCSGEGLADTTGVITVMPDQLAGITIIPDSVDVALGGTVAFGAQGTDAYGNAADVGELGWEVIGGIGRIDQAGTFTAETTGSGQVAATSSMGGIADTNGVVNVLPNSLAMIFVTPDTASVRLSGSIRFEVTGFDAGFETAEVGQVTWEVLGGIGTIDTDGNFLATTTGVGRVAAATSIDGISDTTNMIVVEVPTVSELPLGNDFVYAAQAMVPLLAFTLSNAFEGPETVESIRVRNASKGPGTTEQVLSNIDALALYIDANGNRRLDQFDTRLDGTADISAAVTLSFSPVVIGPGSNRTFFIAAEIFEYPHDGDSLDVFLLPSLDIAMGGGTAVAGPDTLNSLGYAIVDGMTAGQISLDPTGNTTVNLTTGLSHVLTMDAPRNGYSDDVLEIFSVFNVGTADSTDLDSLILYADEGNGAWDGAESESRLGRLSFTGNQWELSGLEVELTARTTRFYLAAGLSPTAANGATLALGVPLHGLEMASDNDGPVDIVVAPVETISISTSEFLSARVMAIPAAGLVPGETTGPLLGIEFVNGYVSPVKIDELRFTLTASDPDGAHQHDLDSQIGSLGLWMNKDGDYAVHGGADSLIASVGISDGVAAFDVDGLTVPASGGAAGVFLEGMLDRYAAKNDNTIGFEVSAPADIEFAQPVDVAGDFPLHNPEIFTIDIFPASSVGVSAVSGTTFYSGEVDCLVFDFTLPPNGYADDQLQSLLIVNRGSMADTDALAAISLWADSGPEGFDGDDILLGLLEESDDSWLISDLNYPVTEGRRFFLTIDIANTDFEGGTVHFEIPVGGVEYRSGASGPDDLPVGNPFSHLIFPANSITVIPIPMDPATVRPGEVNAQVLTFALYNGYQNQPHMLESIRLSNHSLSASSPDYADYELGQASFYSDRNGNRIFDDDSLLASGYFTSGRLGLSGLSVTLPAESLSYFFVAANLPLDAIDSDTLAIAVEVRSDFTFGQTVNINGDFPVSRGGPLVIDGSVVGQYTRVPVGARTLSPGETSVTLFAFRPAADGDQPDVLNAVTIENVADAGPDEIGAMALWLDTNDDGHWQDSDILLVEGINSDGVWSFDDIGLDIEDRAGTLLAVGDVAQTALPNCSFRAAIPVGGCQYASANDGPIDGALVSDETFVISTSGLKITYDPFRPMCTVGQTVDVEAHVTNLLPVRLDSVFCDITAVKVPGTLSPDITRLGPKHLEAGETADFGTSYDTDEPGAVFWEMRAFSTGLAESSATVRTQPTIIQTAPTSVMVNMASSIPTSVTRGQSQVFPLSLSCRHKDISPLTASVRLDSLRLRVEDETGLPQHADLVFSRIVLATGYTNLAILEAIPSASDVLLEFVHPMTLLPADQQILSLQVDIDSLAGAGSYALAVDTGAAMRFVDDNTDMPVAIDPATEFPLRTASCRVTNPSQQLAVSYVPILPDRVNYGQSNVGVMQIVLRHPGSADDSQIQFAGLSFCFTDSQANPINPDEIFSEIKILRQQTVIGLPTVSDPHTGLLTSLFSAPPVLSPGQIDTLKIQVSVRSQTTLTGFELSIRDSTLFTVRDLSSGAMIEAVSDPASSGEGPIFPMTSDLTQLRYPTLAPEVCISSKLPPSVIAGSDAVTLIEVAVNYPSAYERSPVRLEHVQVSILDTLGRALDPDRLFDRIGVSVLGGPVDYESSIELIAGRTVFHVGKNGALIEPGESLTLALVADIEPDAPFDHFVLKIFADGGLGLVDATDESHDPGSVESTGCEDLFPFGTGPTEIFLPAGSPVVRIDALPVRIAYPGQSDLMCLSAEIIYNSLSPQGDLVLEHLRGLILCRTAVGLSPVSGGEIFSSIRLLIDAEAVGRDTLFAADSLAIDVAEELVLPRGSVTPASLVCDLRPDARQGNYVVQFGDSTFIEFADRDLGTTIHPDLIGGDYPVLSAEISVGAGSLAGSFVNWPNPFNPGREATNIGFILAEDAYVDIEVFTVTGELVATITSDSFRPAGSHDDEDMWDGLNDTGHTVQSGTYLCRITARYGSGHTEEVRRKLAVIR